MDRLYPNERRARRTLVIAYPDGDPEMMDNLAYLVSARRHTIDDALALMEKEEKRLAGASSASPATVTSANGATDTVEEVIPPPLGRQQRFKQATKDMAPHPQGVTRPVPLQQRAASSSANNPDSKFGDVVRRRQSAPAITSPPQPSLGAGENGSREMPHATTRHNRVNDTPQPSKVALKLPRNSLVPPSASKPMVRYMYGDDASRFDTEVLGSEEGQVVLFTTSMTSDRRVRDHCRALETLLYIKQIPYHTMDIADNPFLQKKVRELYQAATRSSDMLPMPVLAVDRTFIGTYTEIQDLEDDDRFMRRLEAAGYRHHATTLSAKAKGQASAETVPASAAHDLWAPCGSAESSNVADTQPPSTRSPHESEPEVPVRQKKSRGKCATDEVEPFKPLPMVGATSFSSRHGKDSRPATTSATAPTDEQADRSSKKPEAQPLPRDGGAPPVKTRSNVKWSENSGTLSSRSAEPERALRSRKAPTPLIRVSLDTQQDWKTQPVAEAGSTEIHRLSATKRRDISSPAAGGAGELARALANLNVCSTCTTPTIELTSGTFSATRDLSSTSLSCTRYERYCEPKGWIKRIRGRSGSFSVEQPPDTSVKSTDSPTHKGRRSSQR